MPEIEIRPIIASEVEQITALEHGYSTDFVWQMEMQHFEEEQMRINFREVRLPRSVRVDYPRSSRRSAEEWLDCDGLLVALLAGEVAGYIRLLLNQAPSTAWASDLAVKRRIRRQGIGSALLFAAQEWGMVHECRNLIIEMQPKNYAAIRMAYKLGFDFCGYNDRYYNNHDIGFFFAKGLR
jgi:ribosomal protein S18 acetylase RimI-like enzyme